MPDLDKMNQIAMLAELLSSMPPQQPGGARIPFGIPAKRVQWATELVNDYGIRVHPELASKELVPVDTAQPNGAAAQLGPNFRPRRAIDKIDTAFLLDLLRSAGDVPGLKRLADELQSTIGDPAAETALLQRIAQEQPDVVSTAKRLYEQHLAAQAPPEASEQQ